MIKALPRQARRFQATGGYAIAARSDPSPPFQATFEDAIEAAKPANRPGDHPVEFG